MASIELSAKELLAWRRRQLALGGRSVDLDWLLDLGGGLCWSSMQKLHFDQRQEVRLAQPIESLEKLWLIHIKEHVPLQYLIGRCPWRDFELEVSKAVLIPRQETEILVDLALKRVGKLNKGKGSWADLGTGSGAIAVSLARALDGWQGYAVDCSKDALILAERNLKSLAPKANCQMHLGNWWNPLRPWWGTINLVLCNPPYIPKALLAALAPEVRDHEPRLALCGGIDGLDACREILSGAMQGMMAGGFLMMEHHHDQSDQVLELMRDAGLKDVEFSFDLEGVRRFAIGRRP